MRTYKPEDGVRLTTPVLIGFGSIKAGETCVHKFKQVGESTIPKEQPELTMSTESCTKCKVATRLRVEGPEKILLTEFPGAGVI